MITTYTYSKANRLLSENAGGQLTTYSNDAAGHRTKKESSEGDTYYEWDAVGRMVNAEPPAGVVTFTYNADGQRMAKEGAEGVTGFLYDHKRLLHETDDVGDVENTYVNATQDEYGDLLNEYGEESESFHQFDAQASTNALVDPACDVQGRFKYDAFGSVHAFGQEGLGWVSLTTDQWAAMTTDEWAALPVEGTTTGGTLPTMGFGSQKNYYADLETELYLLGGGAGGRYYDARTGRFVSEDSVPNTNLYPLADNDPVNKVDPSGLHAEEPDEKWPVSRDIRPESTLRHRPYPRGEAIHLPQSTGDSFGMLEVHRISSSESTAAGPPAPTSEEWLAFITAYTEAVDRADGRMAPADVRSLPMTEGIAIALLEAAGRGVVTTESRRQSIESNTGRRGGNRAHSWPGQREKYPGMSDEEIIRLGRERANILRARVLLLQSNNEALQRYMQVFPPVGELIIVSMELPLIVGAGAARPRRSTSAPAPLPKAIRSEVANSVSNLGTAFPVRNTAALNDFAAGSVFSGVYNPQTKQFLAYPSGGTLLRSGDVPANRVARRGGHHTVNEEFSRLIGVDPTSNAGFTMFLEADGSVSVAWVSRSVNRRNPAIAVPEVPVALRGPIMDAIAAATGRTVRSR